MMLKLTGVACQMAQTWWLMKLVDLDRDGILHPIHISAIYITKGKQIHTQIFIQSCWQNNYNLFKYRELFFHGNKNVF